MAPLQPFSVPGRRAPVVHHLLYRGVTEVQCTAGWPDSVQQASIKYSIIGTSLLLVTRSLDSVE